MTNYERNKDKIRLRYLARCTPKTIENRKRREFRKKHIVSDLLSGSSLKDISKKYKIHIRYCRTIINKISPTAYGKFRKIKKQKNHQKIKNRKRKFCNNCKRYKHKKHFHKDKGTITGVRVFCKVCVNKKRMIYRIINKKKIKDYNKKYLKRKKQL